MTCLGVENVHTILSMTTSIVPNGTSVILRVLMESGETKVIEHPTPFLSTPKPSDWEPLDINYSLLLNTGVV